MTKEEIRNHYENELEFEKRQLAFADSQIKWYTRELARERETRKRIVDDIWAQGCPRKIDWELWIKPKNPRTCAERDAERMRNKYYRERKYYLGRIAKTEKWLSEH